MESPHRYHHLRPEDWSYQDFVDTGLVSLCCNLKLFRTDTTQMLMTSDAIVEGLDVA